MTGRVVGFKVAALFLAVLVSVAAAGGQTATPNQPYSPPRTAGGQPNLTGIWQVLNSAAWNIEDHSPALNVPGGFGVVEGGTLPYLPAALATRNENFEKRLTTDPEGNCYLPGVPRVTYMPYPFQILQFPDVVLIVHEYLGIVRSIFLTGKHPDPDFDTYYMGDSRGRWEGNTLVVDVTNFNDQTWFDWAGNFHSEALHVVERFTRTGPDHLSYEVTVEDPEVFSRPWKMSMPVYRRQERNLRLLEYSCYVYMEEEAGKGKMTLPWIKP